MLTLCRMRGCFCWGLAGMLPDMLLARLLNPSFRSAMVLLEASNVAP